MAYIFNKFQICSVLSVLKKQTHSTYVCRRKVVKAQREDHVAILEFKSGGHFGAKEKVGANVNIYLAWTFFMLTKRTWTWIRDTAGGAANGPPRPPLESPLLRLAYRGRKNLTHTSKERQVQRTPMVATARFTIRVFVTFSDCAKNRTQRNRRAKGCEI